MAGSAITAGIVAQDQQTAADDTGESEDLQEMSHLRVVHAVADGPSVEVSIDNESMDSLAFGEASEYANVSGGEAELRVTVTEETDDGNATDGDNATDGAVAGEVDVAGEVLLEENQSLDNRSVTTLVLHSGEDTAADGLQVMELDDDAWEPEEGSSALRVAHLASDGGDVDVTTSGADDGAMDDGAGAADNETEDAGADDTAADGAGADNASDDAGDGVGADDGADDGAAAGNDDAGNGVGAADNETDNETDGVDAGDGVGAADNETDNETDAATDGGAVQPDTQDNESDQQVIADDLGFNETSDYVTVQADDGGSVDVREGDTDNNGTVVTSVEDAMQDGSASTVIVVGDGDGELQAVTTQDATLSVNLPDGAMDGEGAADNETEDAGAEDTATDDAGTDDTEADDAGADDVGDDAGADGADDGVGATEEDDGAAAGDDAGDGVGADDGADDGAAAGNDDAGNGVGADDGTGAGADDGTGAGVDDGAGDAGDT